MKRETLTLVVGFLVPSAVLWRLHNPSNSLLTDQLVVLYNLMLGIQVALNKSVIILISLLFMC
jgi:hypothetical protein